MSSKNRTNDTRLHYGRWLSSCSPEEEVVISGMSGHLPQSKTLHEFRDNLHNKRDMVTHGNRWTVEYSEVPKRSARILDIDKFDAGFFGVHHLQADNMDPTMRVFMETAVETIMDAGINPAELAGTKTGVFVSTSWLGTDYNSLSDIEKPSKFGVTGYLMSLIAQRVSYYLKLKGPAYVVDTACSSSLNTLDIAFNYIRSGQLDSALVGGTNLIMHPGSTLQFFRLGVLSTDGTCRVFDQDASGYVRGETVACVFLQRARDSKRIYAKIVNCKINCDGFTEQGITYPSAKIQQQLMEEIYEESDILPSELSYLETHGTATQVGDPQEVHAIDCAIATKRNTQLLIGSVKSSIGHTEIASGICSLIKGLLALDSGLISPNIHLKQIKKGMEGLEQGRMRVVTELTKLEKEDALIGINNFGFGGNNGHVIIRRHQRVKVNGGIPADDIPRLICVSGRSEEAIKKLLEDVNNSGLDAEYVGLLHNVFKISIENHQYRGYTIVSKGGVVRTSWKPKSHELAPLYLFFGPFEGKFRSLGVYLSEFPVFKNTIARIDKTLTRKNVKSFEEILNNPAEHQYDILGSVCVQIAVIEIFKCLNVTPTAVYTDSYSKLIAAYHYGVVSLEETVATAVKISESNLDSFSQIQNVLNEKHFERNLFGDSLTKFDILKLPKSTIILNISDSHLNNRDVHLVEDNKVKLLEVIGRLFEDGYNPQLQKLYPEIQYPVSRATPMISPSIQWNHHKSWYTYSFKENTGSEVLQIEYEISLMLEENKHLSGHDIHGRILFPATEYLNLVWQSYTEIQHFSFSDVSVVFTNCRFIRAVAVPKTGYVTLLVTIQRGSGDFEVLEKNSLVVTGRMKMEKNMNENLSHLSPIELHEDDSKQIIDVDEVYRELYLRGYNYNGIFKGLMKTNVESTSGLIRWENQWGAFMDKMLHIKILNVDSRLLVVPIAIRKLSIDPRKHLESVKKIDGTEPLIPVFFYDKCDVIKSGGIEICGLQVRSIATKKPPLEPVLEKYEFVPNCSTLRLLEAVRVNIQIILENSLENLFKAVEILDDQTDDANYECLMHLVCKVLDDVPLVTTDLTISSKIVAEESPGVKVQQVTLTNQSNLSLIVGTKVLQRGDNVNQFLSFLGKDGYVLSREELGFVPKLIDQVEIVTEYITPKEKLVLFKKSDFLPSIKCIEISSSGFEWLPVLKKSLNMNANTILYCKNDEPEGILGLVNCIRREPNGSKIKCFFVMDQTEEFEINSNFYRDQVKKNLAINVFQNQKWGTYRHLPVEKAPDVEREHCYANVTSRGDISSIKWLEGFLTHDSKLDKDKILISTYYSSINFKDIMAASGRVNPEMLFKDRIMQECLLGFEFSGRDVSGRRVAGMVSNLSFSTYIAADPDLLWTVPDSWSLEDAATVPTVYATVLYALSLRGDLKPGTSILIHSATGGIGLAALNVCLYHKFNIYVTVGTEEKRNYLKINYPQIPEDHIGNSRDTSFEDMIKLKTKNRGVDVVLNSLSDDKLKASVRCVAKGGHFLEIGKFDLANDTTLEMLFLEKGITYHGVMLDGIFQGHSEKKLTLQQLVEDGIKAGFVKPLPRIVFQKEEIESSFRYMMTGKHMGKVLLKLRREEKENSCVPKRMKFVCKPNFNCNPQLSYIIIGGLGGVGLELADWLMLRGAKKLVLVSRSGVQTGYQKQRINIWRDHGVTVKISTKDVTTREGCSELLNEANQSGPVDAIFNLAVVLKDALFEDQTEASFLTSLSPKARTTIYLDQLTRTLCPNLRYFVIFSSVSCGRGNAGQTNYGMANSVMERICEKRKREGLPAVAIQWGAIGDVGLVAKMQKENKELVIGGTLQQKISSCLEALNIFLTQDYPVVSSMVVAEKHNKNFGILSVVDAVAQVIGIKNMKTISQHSTLAELGMDSMMGTEVIQVLEKDFQIYVTAKDVRSLTFAKLTEMDTDNQAKSEDKPGNKEQLGVNLLIQHIPDISNSHLRIINIKEGIGKTVFLLPGIEGVFNSFETLIKDMPAQILGVQYTHQNSEDTIEELAYSILPYVEQNLSKNTPFSFISYSFGAVVCLELASILEANGYTGTIVAIDGSPTYVKSSIKEQFGANTEEELQTNLFYKVMSMVIPIDILSKSKENFQKCTTLSDRVEFLLGLIPPDVVNKQKLEKQSAIALYKRCKSVIDYKFSHEKIKSKVHLIKPTYPMVDEEEDYQWSKFCENDVKVFEFGGDHVSVLDQPELVQCLKGVFNLK